MNKKISLGAAITFMAITAAVTITITMFFSQRLFNNKVQNLAEREVMYSKLTEVDKYIRANYLGELDENTLNNYIAKGYVAGLGDRYSTYYTPEEYTNEINAYKGNLMGIGVSVSMDSSGYILVHDVYEDSPAETAGILPGDLIVKVNALDVTSTTYQEALEALKTGEVGTAVNLTVRRDNEDIGMEVTRRKLTITSVHSRLISDTVGYIQITEFNDATVAQFQQAINDMQSIGAQSLILDLRSNGGGSVEAMARMADLLLPEGVIVSATYSNDVEKVLHRSGESELNMPMVALMDGNTASSSELFIAALIDYDKCKTVGTTTFGKGVMQDIHQFSDGSAVKLTTAKIFSPKGYNYDGVGIEPEFKVDLVNPDNLPLSELDETTDAQLAKAVEVAKSWEKSYEYGK